MAPVAELLADRYELGIRLGSGGMGDVYRARDTRLKREVALKVLPRFYALDAERLARFRREAEVLATLNHPHIAAIYGLEESGRSIALVLELVPGESLVDRIGRGPLAYDDALAIARQVAEAIDAAHEQGIVHRDLKPHNIRLTPDGLVKVLDFGLAKLIAADASATGDETREDDGAFSSAPSHAGADSATTAIAVAPSTMATAQSSAFAGFRLMTAALPRSAGNRSRPRTSLPSPRSAERRGTG